MGDLQHKPILRYARMGKERSMRLIEQEMQGAMEGILKEETYNLYGCDARTVEIQALEEHGP